MAAAVTLQVWKCRSCGGEYVDVQADGSPYFHACPPLPGLAARPRPDARDENIAVSVSGKPRRAIGVIAEGKGTQCLTNQKLTEPARITALKARIAKEQEQWQ